MGKLGPLSRYLAVALVSSVSCGNRESSTSQPPSAEMPKVDLGSIVHLSVENKFDSAIRTIFQDSKGTYWFGSQEEGVARFDGKSFTYFSVEDGLASNQVTAVQEARDGTIWVGTPKGVSSYDGKTLKAHPPDTQLQGDWSIAAGDLWFSAGNTAGVYRYHGERLEYLAFPETKTTNFDNIYHTTGIASGNDGALWFATYSGVFGYDGKSFTILNDETIGLGEGTGQLHVRSILKDSRGRLWIGNNGIGVLLVNAGATIDFSKDMGLVSPNSPRNGDISPNGTLEHVFAIEEDRFGNIWFGDRDTGAWKYDGKTVENYSVGDGTPTPMVTDIYRDRGGELLFALDTGAVFQFNGKRFSRFPFTDFSH